MLISLSPKDVSLNVSHVSFLTATAEFLSKEVNESSVYRPVVINLDHHFSFRNNMWNQAYPKGARSVILPMGAQNRRSTGRMRGGSRR